MKNFVLLAIALFMAIASQQAQAQCSATIGHTGKGCIGDTLKLSASNVTNIVWKRGSVVKKTLNATPAKYGLTVAGQKNGASGTDSMHLASALGVQVDAAGNVYVADWNNNRVQKWAPGAKYGVTVAGQKNGSAGSDSMHLNNPYMIFVDSAGNVYVADTKNNRVQRWAPGAKYGVTVAGQKNGSSGSDSLHLNGPIGVYVDRHQNVYVSEDQNYRVTKWAKGAKYGTTVAGKSGAAGTDSLHLGHPYGIFVDASGSVYVADYYNNRVQKWAAGAKYGTTVAGQKNGSSGTDSTKTTSPVGLFVDACGNVYVSAYNRVQIWAPGAKYGITVAGHKDCTSGTDSTYFKALSGIFIDANNNLYVGDNGNNRVQKLALGILSLPYFLVSDTAGVYSATVTLISGSSTTSTGVVIAAQSTSALSACIKTGSSYSFNGSSYTSAGTYTAKLTNKAGCDSTITLTLTAYTDTMIHTGKGCVGDTLKLSTSSATSIVWKRGSSIKKTLNAVAASYGITVAGQKNGSSGTDSMHLSNAASVIVDASGNLYVAEWNNNRVTKWAPGAKFGVTVAGQKNCSAGTDSMHLQQPYFISVDSAGNIYVADCHNNRVQRWAPGAKYGVTVAGQKNGTGGSDSTQLNYPAGIYVDRQGNIYIGDILNNRVQKWAKGAKFGTTIAGQKNGASGSDSAHFNNPYGVWLDGSNNVYVVDRFNYRVQKWAPGAKFGITVAGQKNATSGKDSTKLNSPVGVFIDATGNVYVTDEGNGRVQKWAPGSKYGITVAGHKNSTLGTDSTGLNGGTGLFIDSYSNLFVADEHNNRVQKWTFGITPPYTLVGDTAGNYTATVMINGCTITSNSITIGNKTVSSTNANLCSGKSYTFNGTTYTAAGTYTAHLTNKAGCDSAAALILTAAASSASSLSACIKNGSSYSFNGSSYTSSGTYTAKLTNKAGCDSTITLTLTAYTDTMTHTGKGCVGDTLKLSATGATNIVWKRGSIIKKILNGTPAKYGTVVAGQKSGASGTDSAHLNAATGVFTDAAGNVYVSDWNNNRVQKWAPGAKYGVTVAGQKNGSSGSDSTHLNNPYNLFVDSAGNLYVVDCNNNRVQRWAPGAKYGVTVAGQKSGSGGSDSMHLSGPIGLYVDGKQNVYVSEDHNNRVQKWAKGAKYGTTVAGQKSGAGGTDSMHLNHAYGIWLDATANVYIADLSNNRVQKWAPGAKYGTTVAGQKNCSSGLDSMHLNTPYAVSVDGAGNVYALDAANNRVQKWAPGSKYGVTIAGHKNGTFSSTDSTCINGNAIYIDASSNLYAAQYGQSRAIKWSLGSLAPPFTLVADTAGTYTANVTFGSGCTFTSNSITIGKGTTSTTNANFCPGKSYTFNGTTYTTAGTYTAHLSNKAGCDSAASLVLSAKSTSSSTVSACIKTGSSYSFNGSTYTSAGTYTAKLTNKAGCDSTITLTLTAYTDTITLTGKGCVGDTLKLSATGATNVVWKRGSVIKKILNTVPAKYGITVAGQKNGTSGSDSVHLNYPCGVFVDALGNVYASDWYNNRIQKWAPGAKYGVTVAGQKNGVSGTDSLHLKNPNYIFVDTAGNLYIADCFNHRVQKWVPGAKYGVTVAGQKNGTTGSDSTHLSNVSAVYVDAKGNVYVSEATNHRVSKWAPGAKYGVTVAGQKSGTSGTDSAHLNGPGGIWVDASANIYIADGSNHRVQKWAPGAKYGVTVDGQKNGVSGTDSTHLDFPGGVYLDNTGNVYVSTSYQVVKWAPGAKYGVNVAGLKSGASGTDSTSLKSSNQIIMDAYGNLYIADNGNNRIQKWSLGSGNITATYVTDSAGTYTANVTFGSGCTITSNSVTINAGTASTTNASICTGKSYMFNGTTYTSAGTYTAHLTNKKGCDSAASLKLTINNNIIVTLYDTICPGSSFTFNGKSLSTSGTYKDTVVLKSGCDSITTLNLAVNTVTITNKGKGCVGDTLKVNVNGASNIVWKRGSVVKKSILPTPVTFGTTVAGQKNGSHGTDSTHLFFPVSVYVDNTGNYIISDYGNNRIQKWAPGANHGVTIAGQASAASGSDSVHFNSNLGMFLDSAGNLYVADYGNNRVQKWSAGAKYGVTVAGQKNGAGGVGAAYLKSPQDVWLDRHGNVFVTDIGNSRVQKWAPGATSGTTVAGVTGTGGTDSIYTWGPTGITGDSLGNLYITEVYANRVSKWAPGATHGVTVAGQKNGASGSDSAHLNTPMSVRLDKAGNVYVGDGSNNRIQKWAPGAKYGVTIAGQKNGASGTDSLHLSSPWGININTAKNILYVCDEDNNRIQAWNLPKKLTGSYTLVTDSAGSYTATVTQGGCTVTSNSIAIGNKSTSTTNASICTGKSYTFNGTTYTSSGTYTAHLTNKAGCDSAASLILTSKASTASTLSASICSGSTYMLNGRSFTTAGVFKDTIANKAGCDSIITLTLSVKNKSTSTVTASICNGTGYVFNGSTYKAAGTYTAHLTNKVGCDSAITLTLTVKDTSKTTVNATICSNKSYTFNGTTYTTAGTYTAKLTNKTGCDSVVTLNLTVNATSSSSVNATICSNKSYTFNGTTYTTAGTYTATLTNKKGCDSVITLNLKVNSPSSSAVSAIICSGNSYTLNGKSFKSTGVYYDTVTNKVGCDSIITLTLTVNSKSSSAVSAKICQGKFYQFNGTNYFATGSYTAHLTNKVGCDSAVTLTLTVNDTNAVIVNAAVCSGIAYSFNGSSYSATGSYTVKLTNKAGCDSLAILHLLVNAKSYTTITTGICAGNSYTFNGSAYTTTGTYTATLTNSKGCDSLITLYLTVNTKSYGTDTAATCMGTPFNLHGKMFGTAGVYNDTIKNKGGCDSIITLTLTVKPTSTGSVTATTCSNKPYSFRGKSFSTAGTYIDTLTNSVACDSIVTINLTVNNISSKSTGATICAGKSYLFGGRSYGANGTYYDTLMNANSCDSIIGLTLSVNSNTAATVNAGTCPSIPYMFHGKSFTATGTYFDTLKNNKLCDSVVTINLTVNKQTTNTISAATCSNISFMFHGKSYSTPGTYTDTLSNSKKCDSIVTINLKINAVTYSTVNAKSCSNTPYGFHSKTYSASGTYIDTVKNSNNCDSIITLNLKVSKTSNDTIVAGICPGKSYLLGGKSYTTAGIYVDTVINKNSCDSFILLNLTVNAIKHTSLNTSICDGKAFIFNGASYKVAGTYYDTLASKKGCDSVITLYLKVQANSRSYSYATICGGKSYLFNGKYYNASGSYNDTLGSSIGCDSIATLNLTVNKPTAQTLYDTIKGGAPITVNKKTYNVIGTFNDTIYYAGTKCDSVTLTINISYPTGIINVAPSINRLSVFPNPNEGRFIVDIESADRVNKINVALVNILGQPVEEHLVGNIKGKVQVEVNNKYLASGLYMIKVTQGGVSKSTRVIIGR